MLLIGFALERVAMDGTEICSDVRLARVHCSLDTYVFGVLRSIQAVLCLCTCNNY